MSEQIPEKIPVKVTDASVRESVMFVNLHLRDEDTNQIGTKLSVEISTAYDEWLAAHDAEVARKTLEDAKKALREHAGELVHHEDPDPGYGSMVRAGVANWKHGPARGYTGGIEAALEILRARAASISTDKAGGDFFSDGPNELPSAIKKEG